MDKYVDIIRNELQFVVTNKINLKVFPTKGEVRFRSTGKLKSRYRGPFDIFEKVRRLAYEVALPPILDGMYIVFHVFMLKKYVWDESHIIPKSLMRKAHWRC